MKEFWFVVGSQDLYGQEVLDTVAARATPPSQAAQSARYASRGPLPSSV